MTSDQQQAPAATVTTPADREIHIERVFDAPRDRVFAVYTDPQLIPEWWGPRDTTAVVDQMDVRPGGSWRFVIRHLDGSETAFRGTYREVISPERIAQTFEWEGMPGHIWSGAVMEDLMLYPHVTEIVRAGSGGPAFPRTQRELVALSLCVNPAPTTTRSIIDRDSRGGIFR